MAAKEAHLRSGFLGVVTKAAFAGTETFLTARREVSAEHKP